MKYIQWLNNWLKQKKTHYLFPLLPFAIGLCLGMFTNPTIGAIFFSIMIFLGLVIFVPWDKIKIKKVFIRYSISAVICVIFAFPMWNNIVSIFPSPYKELIKTATASVDVIVKSDEDVGGRTLSGDAYLAFCRGKDPLLETRATETFYTPIGEGRVLHYGTFNMDVDSETTNETVKYLEQTEYIEIAFSILAKNMEVTDGKAVVVINNSVRFEFIIPTQNITDARRIFVRDVQENISDVIR